MSKKFSADAELIWDLAINDFKRKYAGSYFGIVWAFVQPVITILVYWIVFQYGLKVQISTMDVPYILWFITAMVPWLFFSEGLSSGANCLLEYNYLVNKVIFPVTALPVVKVISAFFVHLVFVAFLFIVFVFYNAVYTIRFGLLVYFMLCLFIYILAFAFLSSAIIVFFRDFGQIISIFLQVGMWATPILWDYSIIPNKFLWIMKLNPLFYITEGYRIAFLGISELDVYQGVYFWIFALVLLTVSIWMFKKLQKHFADVL